VAFVFPRVILRHALCREIRVSVIINSLKRNVLRRPALRFFHCPFFIFFSVFSLMIFCSCRSVFRPALLIMVPRYLLTRLMFVLLSTALTEAETQPPRVLFTKMQTRVWSVSN
jgi:hypothetical protein